MNRPETLIPPAPEQVLGLLEKIASQRRTTLLVVTHSDDVARLATRQIGLRDGQIISLMSTTAEIREQLRSKVLFREFTDPEMEEFIDLLDRRDAAAGRDDRAPG